jgi:tetraacyldisaccharide 4'-kinase
VIAGERELRDVWYGNRPPALSLRVLESLYAALTALRRALYRSGILRHLRAGVPVVVVGNVTAGGTGKTPLTIALVEALRERGFKPAVVSRGYGSSTRGPTIVTARHGAAEVGEEPLLIARATQAPVAVGRDRVAAARLLVDSAAADVIVADDGLQHYRLQRDLEVCVIDGERRFGNGRLLPAGPLREPQSRAAACDFRVCNGGAPQQGEITMLLAGDAAVALQSGERRRLSEFAGQRAHALAGIGNPGRFFAMLRTAGIEAVEHAYPDHHPFAPADVRFDDDQPVLMTEKDAIKCVAFADGRHWFVPVRAQLPREFFDAVAAKVRASALSSSAS